jgi:signal-transduction protein with cAMP-binding, CBS, and nucleotidyltransferase domain
MSLSRWVRQVRGWTRQGEGRPLRMCDIFFDLACVDGDAELAAALREAVTDAAAHPHFLRALYRVDEVHGVALDLFGRLAGDPLPGPGHGQVQLKLTGLLPLVGAVRIAALGQRIAATGTRERLAALTDAGVIDADRHEALDDAFERICRALLVRQLDDLRAGRPPGGHVPADSLGRLERRRLVEALRAVRHYRDDLRSALQGEPVFRIAPAGP